MIKARLRSRKGEVSGWRDGWMDVTEVEAVFVSLPVRHSKSEADKVILRAVHHQAADSFMASRLAVRAADYNERGRRGETGERRGRREGGNIQEGVWK